MRISSDIVGREVGPDEQILDERWLMAYNAALGKLELEAHPLFPVCYEWPATRLLREGAGLVPLDARLVHAQHDLLLHRKPRPGRVRVAGKVVAAAQKKPGALVVFRFTAHDEQGLISATDFCALYRDVKLDGPDRSVAAIEDPPKHDAALEPIGEVAVPATAAHVYTECARIWNPIHTDRAYARAAGLPDIILHGTATLALSVSKVVDVMKPEVRRVRCRFAGMVLMPNTLTVHASRQGDGIAFAASNARGETVIDRGWIS